MWSRTLGSRGSALAYDDGRLLVISDDGLLQALDPRPGAPSGPSTCPSAPAADGGAVYVGGAAAAARSLRSTS